MNNMKFFISLALATGILLVQVGGAFAAAASQTIPSITGTVQSISLVTDSSTGITTVIVDVMSEDLTIQEARISQKSAEKLGLIIPDDDGNPVINQAVLGQSVEIKLTMVIPNHEADRHPVGNALETFFADIEGLDYNLIMDQRAKGFGFGAIAQALWLTRQIDGSAMDFQNLLLAKQTGDYGEFSSYLLEDGTAPTNWGQLRKAILLVNQKDDSPIVISNQNNNDRENNQAQGRDKQKNKDKEKDKGSDGDRGNPGNGNRP